LGNSRILDKAEARFMPLQSFARTFSTLLTIVAFGLRRRVSVRLVPWLSQDGQSMVAAMPYRYSNEATSTDISGVFERFMTNLIENPAAERLRTEKNAISRSSKPPQGSRSPNFDLSAPNGKAKHT